MQSTNARRVILVEDQELLRSLLFEVIADAGFTVIQTSSADSAIEALKGEAGRAVVGLVTDIDLGSGPTGWVLAARAREMHPNLPVIYMSGSSAYKWTTLGVAGSRMIPKPFTVDRLVDSLLELTADR